MGVEENNPNEMIHIGMDISVGALPPRPVRNRKSKNEDLQLGSSVCFHGIPPQRRFIDEKYFDQWKVKQVEYKARLVDIKESRIERSKGEFDREHNHLLSLCGPEWYQELSPNQKDIIDQLNKSIEKDLASHLTKSTQSSLSLLGMRPLPNDKQLWKALIRSYGCPIEFLLILFDLMKPQRNHYSMNDRLLLSGVAHLCLRHTLKEMHVRCPSPPRSEPKVLTPKPKPPKKKYPHVYLIPFTFKWPLRKRSEYKNPVVQKPECPYFSYVCDMTKERIVCFEEADEVDRADENIKIPCELFEDHLKAEEIYNSIFKRYDKCRYQIMRARNYESITPKQYPGILPQYMLKKRYPLALKLFFNFKIYDEINPKNDKTRKVIRAICEAKKIPVGRPGQVMAQTLIAKFVYIKNIGQYLQENIHTDISEDQSEAFFDHPCSVCGGPDRKEPPSEMKPQKVKTYIKQIRKPKEKRVYRDWSPSESLETNKVKEEVVVQLNEDALKLKLENKKYFAAWKNIFENIERLEKLRLETKECVCPDKTRDKSKTEPENDCTCAVWNLPPPPPPPVPAKISCECKPQIVEPEKKKCDCKHQAREKAAEACEQCGVVKPKQKKIDDKDSVCGCMQNRCGNCVKKTADYNQEFTVGYVFTDNQPRNADSSNPRDSIAKCSTCKKHLNTKNDLKLKQNHQTSVDELNKNQSNLEEKCGLSDGHPATEEQCEAYRENLRIREKYLKLDYCRRETQKLLKLLKCDCSKCKDLRKKYRSKYIQAGTLDACGGVIPVLGGAFGSNNECDCLKKFEERVEGVHDYRKRMKAKLALKSQKNSYIINGVTQTPKGPIYNISGIIPTIPKPPPCMCDTEQEVDSERIKRDKLMDKIEDGYKYVISGVKHDSSVNEYIIGGRIKECHCSDVFTQFMEKHNECLVSYENYLKYMNKEIIEYTKEMNEKYSQLPLSAQQLLDQEVRRLKGPPGLPVPGGKSEFVVSGVQEKEFEKSFVLGGLLLREKKSEEYVIAIQSYTSSTENKGLSKCQRTYLCNYMTFGKNCGNPFKPATNDLDDKTSSEELICQCISYESLQEIPSLELGDTEKVCIVQKKDSKQMFAMKYMNKHQCVERDALKNVLREVDILTRLEHPFLVNIWFSFQDEEDLFMVTDLLLGGDLRYHIQQAVYFSEDAVKLMICELGLALDYLQSKKIIHRDIKPDNILLDEIGHFHITDFNIATVVEDNHLATSMSGTKPYIAPEIFECAMELCVGYSYAVDWWSLGAVAYEMLKGARPFDIHSNTCIQDVRILFQIGVDYPKTWSESIVELISRLLCVSPGMRISNLVELKHIKCLHKYDMERVFQRLYHPPFQPPKDHLNCDPTFELEEMIIESKPLHKKKKRLAKQRSIREIQNPVSVEMDTESPMEMQHSIIPDFKIYNRYLELERKERERKEQAWEEELQTAMNSSDPLRRSETADNLKQYSSSSSKICEDECHNVSMEIKDVLVSTINSKTTFSCSQLLKISEEEEKIAPVQNNLQNLDFIDRTPSPVEKKCNG